MLKHSFGIYMKPDSRLSYGFGASNLEYWMLNYLSTNDTLLIVDDILLNLSKVRSGEQEEFGWGADFCIIISRQEQSTIQYYEFAKPDWHQHPLFIEIPTKWFIPSMRDWRQFLTLNSRESYQKSRNKMLFAGFGIQPISEKGQSNPIYALRVNHLHYETEMFNDLAQYNQLATVDVVLEQLSQVVEKKQEQYVWGQKNLKLTSGSEQTMMEYQSPDHPAVLSKTIPTEWLLNLMWDWRLFLELNPKTAYSGSPKGKRASKKK